MAKMIAKSRQTPNAKRQTPNAKRQTPNAKRQTPNAKRQTPNAKRKGPPENYGKEKHTTVAAFLPWRGS
jgi:hypothetical protein